VEVEKGDTKKKSTHFFPPSSSTEYGPSFAHTFERKGEGEEVMVEPTFFPLLLIISPVIPQVSAREREKRKEGARFLSPFLHKFSTSSPFMTQRER